MIIIPMILLFSFITYITFTPSLHRLTKRKFFSLSAILLSFAMLSACGGNNVALDLEKEIEKNELLIEENEEMEENLEKLQGKYDELFTSIKELDDKNKKLLDQNEFLSTKYEKSSDDIVALENENKQLQTKLDEEKEASVSSTSVATSTNTSGTTSSQENSSSTSDSSIASENCNIKGSVNGIYHVPGSTYYNRTKNVVQWFCSTEEAENAGYRAPEK